jgi:transcriptional regulator
MQSTDADFLEGMLNGIVGFEIEVTQIEGCWKLSQHHDSDRRERVIDALRQRATGDDIEIANLMQKHSRQES